ncbi:MAG: TIGR00282 family metallophosphoesterase [Alphaproteobacteria bacterium]|nr:TIGR00282 family metallophosphoesterase [Alphaproteobacteria bacterium]MBU0798479.1 TIGR00282 family metallophosphoesterase [Alphaproteobacteria bacterium]MBU0886724.1 TIGR00282 family metallophosphoesterase [Alphaproteobacteria bacterium]MBU1812548.1 TIGR00282 family metallophosphoesterase [Alphaproteobacteria bacterium]
MRLLFLGDVVGRPGRDAITSHLPDLRRELKLDFIVVNGENAAGGFGITQKICEEFYALGVDVVTTGNHAWDQRETLSYINADPRLLRPANYPPGTPGKGAHVHTTQSGKKVLVVNVMGRLFMDALDDPFRAVERELAQYVLGGGVQAAIIDIHAEATSEKMAMGHLYDGRVSLVVGTHSHVPTADAQILPGKTAYQTDAGMCGDYDSVIGMRKDIAVARFVRKLPGERLEPSSGEGTLCGVFVETDDRTGLATRVEPVRRGGRLAPATPVV